MGILGLIDIGSSALAAHKAAIEVTGDNIANASTPGYSRQTAILAERIPAGSGVTLATVQRAYNQYLQASINTQNSVNYQQTAEQSALQRIEPLFGDLSGDGLAASLQNFFGAWQDLSLNPQGKSERQAVLGDAQALVEQFHRVSGGLARVRQDSEGSLAGIVSGINDKAAQIAALNDQIARARAAGGNPNALADSRDQLIQGLAQQVGISTLQQSDGTVTVSLTRGPQLVAGTGSATLSLRADPANGGLSGVMLSQPGEKTATDITPLVSGDDARSGTLGGTLRVRDRLVPGFQASLDELAATLADRVNTAHAAGFGLNGSTGVDFFAPPPAPTPPAAFPAGFSAGITLNVTNTDDIAAASVDPTQPGSGTGNNLNAQKVAGLADTSLPMTGGSTTLSGFYASLVGSVGQAVQGTDQEVTQGSAALSQLTSLRDSASGVSLDEELTNLIAYQKAFEGAAKLITTGQEMMDTLLGMVR